MFPSFFSHHNWTSVFQTVNFFFKEETLLDIFNLYSTKTVFFRGVTADESSQVMWLSWPGNARKEIPSNLGAEASRGI